MRFGLGQRIAQRECSPPRSVALLGTHAGAVEGARIAVAVPVSGGHANGECAAGKYDTDLHRHDDRFVDVDDSLQQSFVWSVLPEARPATDTDYAYDGDDDGALHDAHDNDLNRVGHTVEHIVFRAGVLPEARPAADGADDFGDNYDCGANDDGIDDRIVVRGAVHGDSYRHAPIVRRKVLPHDGEATNVLDEHGADCPDDAADHDRDDIRPRRGPRNAVSLPHYRALRSRVRRSYDARRARHRRRPRRLLRGRPAQCAVGAHAGAHRGRRPENVERRR